jgi:SAM-dependent methyltransferase
MSEESRADDVTDAGVFQSVLDGYTAVYDALPNGATFNRIWRDKAYRGEFPIEFAHIGFLTLTEAERLHTLFGVRAGSTFADVACGAGGPGLWMAQQSGATLVGVDPAEPGLAAARRRAEAVQLSDRATFQQGTFEHTGLADNAVDALMSIEAFQYAPDKRAALTEFVRIIRQGGKVSFVCFEVDPDKVEGVPVLGVDPVDDYRPLLEDAGFVIDVYEETPGWEDRVYAVFESLIDASDALNAEMGEQAAAGALAEATLTVAMKPYPRRVLAVATAP